MKLGKKLLVLLTAICVMMSVVIPASAFTSQNVVTMDFSGVTTDEQGKVTDPNGVYGTEKGVTTSAVYYDNTTDTLSIVCAKDETQKNGRMGFYNAKSYAVATDTVKLSTKIDLTQQTGDVQIRLCGYYYTGSDDKNTQKETITIGNDGKVKLFGGTTSIVLEKKEYDVTLYYTPAKRTTGSDGKTASVGKATAKLIFEIVL